MKFKEESLDIVFCTFELFQIFFPCLFKGGIVSRPVMFLAVCYKPHIQSESLFRKQPFCIHRTESEGGVWVCLIFLMPFAQVILYSFISWMMLLNQTFKLRILKGCYKKCGPLKMGVTGVTMK